jgi:hypothetical protein
VLVILPKFLGISFSQISGLSLKVIATWQLEHLFETHMNQNIKTTDNKDCVLTRVIMYINIKQNKEVKSYLSSRRKLVLDWNPRQVVALRV